MSIFSTLEAGGKKAGDLLFQAKDVQDFYNIFLIVGGSEVKLSLSATVATVYAGLSEQ